MLTMPVSFSWRRAFVHVALVLFAASGSAVAQCPGGELDPAAPFFAFGVGVALEGDLAAATGDLAVFRWDGQAWVEEPVAQGGAMAAIALGGERIVTAQTPGPIGNLVVREKQLGVWETTATLPFADLGDFALNEGGIAIDGDWLAAGAPSAIPQSDPSAGTVRLYEEQAGVWTLAQELTPADATVGQAFGCSLALVGDRLVVGSPGDGMSVPASVHVYERQAGTWVEVQVLTHGAPDRFGFALALDDSGTRLAVGTPVPGMNGVILMFELDAGAFVQTAVLQASIPIGQAVALDGDVLLTSSIVSGMAAVFACDDGVWTERAILDAGTGSPGITGIPAIALDGDRALVGEFVLFTFSKVLWFEGLAGLPSWEGVGSPLGGGGFEPCAFGTGVLAPGQQAGYTLTGGPSQHPTVLVIGFSELWAPFGGGWLVPVPNLVLPGVQTDAAGRLEVLGTLPDDAAVLGLELWLQSWLPDVPAPGAWVSSNAVHGVVD